MGSTLRVVVSATNKNGSAFATSAPTTPVLASTVSPGTTTGGSSTTTTTTSTTTTTPTTTTTTPTTTTTTPTTTTSSTTTTSATGGPSWVADYDTGNLSQWTHPLFNTNLSANIVSGDFAAVTAPLRQGSHAGKFVVNPGDCPFGCPEEERAEAFLDPNNTQGLEGKDEWYAWSSYFPNTNSALGDTSRPGFGSTNPIAGHQNMFTQWHGIYSGEANIGLMINKVPAGSASYTIQLFVNGCSPSSPCHLAVPSGHSGYVTAADTYINLADMTALWNRWLDFRVHIHWSSDPSKGSIQIEMAHDGSGYQTILPKTSAATLYTSGNTTQGNGAYLKQGWYRMNVNGTLTNLSSTVYHDGMRIGSTAADVSY